LLFSDHYRRADLYSNYYGVNIRKDARITGNVDFGDEPYLIKIGDHVTLTQDIKFLTHDGGVGLFREESPGINILGKITIGDHVFIGENSMILPNVTIGNWVIVGAGIVVTKDIPDNVVCAGVPARVIKSINEYKREAIEKSLIINIPDSEERTNIIKQYFNSR